MSPDMWKTFIRNHLKPARQQPCNKWSWSTLYPAPTVANSAVTLRALIQASLSGESPSELQVPPALQILGCSKEDVSRLFEGLGVAELDMIRDNFGWLRDTEQAFLARDPKAWPLLHKLSMLTDPESADPTPNHLAEGLADELSDLWTPGCQPVVVDGKLEAVLLRLPYSDFFPSHPYGGNDSCRVAYSEGDFNLRPLPVGFGGVAWDSKEYAGRSNRLGLMTYVLTPQRAQILSRAIELPKTDRHGLLVTGPVGSGKTATLQALALMLTVGAGGDLLFFPSACSLSRSMLSLGSHLAEFGLGYSCGEALVSEELHSLFGELESSVKSEQALAKLLHPTKGHYTAKRGEAGAPPRTMIVNNAFFLHEELLEERGTRDTKHWQVVQQLLTWADPSNKVIAYGPEVHRLSDFGKKDRKEFFKFPPRTDMRSTFMELGNFSHNLAMHLLCGQAPNTSPGKHKEDTLENTPVGTVTDFMWSRRYHKNLSSDPDVLSKLHKFVKHVAAEPRMLIKLVPLCDLHSHTKDKVVEDFKQLVEGESLRLGDFLTRHVKQRIAKGADATVYPQLMSAGMLMSFYVLQRKNPLDMDLAGNTQCSTYTGFKTLIEALLETERSQKQLYLYSKDEQSQAMRQLAAVVPDFAHDQQYSMCVAMLLKMGLFGGQYDQLSIAGGPTPEQMLGNWALTPQRCSGFLQLRRMRDSPRLDNKGINTVAFTDIAALHGLPVDGVHAAQMHEAFPNLDFVVFRRANQDGRDRLQICFMVATTAPLSFKTNLQPLQNLKSEVGEAEAAELLNSGSLMRFIGLIADESWHVQPGHLAQTMALSCGSGERAELWGHAEPKLGSLASSVLWSFGVPVAVPGHIRRNEGGQPVLSMRPEIVGSEHRSELQEHVRKVLEAEAEASTGSAGSCGEDGRRTATFIDSISRPEDVDLFFVYCTAMDKCDDAGLHDPRLCDVPSYLGVFGNENMCALHMVGVP